MSTDDLPSDINVRSDVYFIARTSGQCGRCGEPTRMVALAVPADHETLELDADAQSDDVADDIWQRADAAALLFYVVYAPRAVRDRIRHLCTHFRFAFSQSHGSTYWMNHCEHCGAQQEDEQLFCEPEGAFMPMSPEGAAAIELLAVSESFGVVAGGYSSEPELFAFMRFA